MGRRMIGTVLGAVILFAWGMISWMVLPFHDSAVKTLPEEKLVRDVLKTVVQEPGIYFFPSRRTAEGLMPESEWRATYRSGPSGFLAYRPVGGEPMDVRTFALAILGDVAVAALLMAALRAARSTVQTLTARGGFALLLGALVWFAAHVPHWNWFSFSTSYTVSLLVDCLAGFGAMGLAMAPWVDDRPSVAEPRRPL